MSLAGCSGLPMVGSLKAAGVLARIAGVGPPAGGWHSSLHCACSCLLVASCGQPWAAYCHQALQVGGASAAGSPLALCWACPHHWQHLVCAY